MSLFSTIMDKIFQPAEAASPAAEAAAPSSGAPAAGRAQPSTQARPAAGQARPQVVDVEAVLTQMASKKGGGKWRTSIVDLLKLLGLDSSLAARKELADELNLHVGADGSAEQNIALHKAVMRKLAENGGKVPDSMKN